MSIIAMVFAILTGYLMGLLQKGININLTQKEPEEPQKEPYESVGNEEFMQYHLKTGGRNDY